MAFFSAPLDFYLQIRKGKIMGHEPISIGGSNPSAGTTWETLWTEGGIISYPSSATTLKISSSSASDTGAGDGLRTIKIKGLDASFNPVEEEITLNGQTGVTTSNTYYRINGLTGLTAGPDGSNQGTIYIGDGTITAGIPDTIYTTIAPNDNRSMTAIYTVPKGYSLFMTNMEFSNIASIGSFKFIRRPSGGIFYSSSTFSCDTSRDKIIRAAPGFGEGSDIQFQSKVETGTSTTAIYVEGILVDNRSG